MLHDLANDDGYVRSNELRTEKDGDTEKRCQKPPLQPVVKVRGAGGAQPPPPAPT